MEQKEVILDVQHLQTYFLGGDKKHRTEMRASDDLSYQVHKGEFVAIVGESGSGKSVSALSVMGLIPYPPRTGGGRQDPVSRQGSGALHG